MVGIQSTLFSSGGSSKKKKKFSPLMTRSIATKHNLQAEFILGGHLSSEKLRRRGQVRHPLEKNEDHFLEC